MWPHLKHLHLQNFQLITFIILERSSKQNLDYIYEFSSRHVEYLSPIYVVQDKVELLWGLEGVVEPNQERMFQTLQQDISLCHNVLLLMKGNREINVK